jgi:glucose/arabinose dehydrogenase
MSRITKALLALALLALAAPASAAAAPRLEPVGTFEGPVHAIGAPGDPSRLYVVEIGGRVRLVRDGIVQPTPFLTIDDVLGGGERGLLSIAFPPDYATSGLFYVYLTSEPAGDLEVREYRRSAGNPDLADPASGRLVWSAAHPGQDNHNGGTVAFGPDGKLWFATGDGGGSNDPLRNARDPAHPLGKLLRIDPRQGNAGSYTIPADNPFGNAVWAYGLRNPFRFTFDRIAGDLWIGDVGQDAWEEIDHVSLRQASGANFGWDLFEGDHPFDGDAGNPPPAYRPPVLEYSSAGGANCAVTGGYVVRDRSLRALAGRYLYADFCGGELRSFKPGAPGPSDASTGLHVDQPSSFGEVNDGTLFVASLAGPVYRIGH